MSRVYLAYSNSSGFQSLAKGPGRDPANVLVAFPEAPKFFKIRTQLAYSHWMLDSGAWSVYNSGKKIDLQQYIEFCKLCDADEVVALDVIQDWKGSVKNTEAMWKAGVKAIPVYHVGEPEEALLEMARNFPKIGIGTSIRKYSGIREQWIAQVFARVWPKKIHGFGLTHWNIASRFPFHSVDSATWAIAPSAYGAWTCFTGKQISLKARGIRDYRAEVEHFMKLERLLTNRWKNELASLEPAAK